MRASQRTRFGWMAAVFAACATLASLHAVAAVHVSEVLLVNQRGLTDEQGQRSGWIELHNSGNAPDNLNGWFLSDDTNQPTKWRFPAVVLLPEKSLTVYASGKTGATNPAYLHAAFKLSPNGAAVALYNAATGLVSSLKVPALPPDQSFGVARGEPSAQGIFSRPTPGKPNATFGPGFGPEVKFSRGSSNFQDELKLTLSCTSAAAVIRFTFDGRLPDSNSPAYSAPIEITNTAQVRARAFEPGKLPGPPHSETFLKLHTNALQFSSSLPLLVMDTLGRDVPTSSHEMFVQLSLHEPVNGKSSLTNEPTLTSRAGYRVRGSTSAGMPQAGFGVQFLNEFNDEQERKILGMPADSDWILYAPNSFDPVLIHNPFVHQLSRDIGQYSPRTRFVEVFWVRSSGRVRETYYNGVYVLIEKIKAGKHRVNVEKLRAEDLYPPNVTGGYLLKFDRVGPGEGGFGFNGTQGSFVEPREQTLNQPQRLLQKQYLTTYFNEFTAALNGPNWMNPTSGFRGYLDLNAAIDYHIVEVLSGNVDSMVLSSYFYKPRNAKIICGPHWDFDRALGSTDGRDANPRQWNTGPFFGGPWWPRVFSDPDAWQQWVDRWETLRESHLSLTNLNRLVDQLAGELKDAQPRQYAKWNFQPRGGSYKSELDLMKGWLSNRIDFIDQQLVQPPAINGKADGSVPLALTVPTNVTIRYTLDGTDPRLPQGGVATNSVVYSAPIALTAKVKVVARAYNPATRQSGGPPVSTPWSKPIRVSLPST